MPPRRWPVTNLELLQHAPQLSKSNSQTSALQRFCTVVLFSPSDQLPSLFPSSKLNRDRPKFCPLSTFLLKVSRQPATHAQPLDLNTRGCNNCNLSPLCFHGLTNCFSRNSLVFKIFCVAPRGVPRISSKERKNDPANR